MLGVGDRLRNYEVLAQLKLGGMGTLYLGRRLGAAGFAQHVAIKVIHPHLSSEPMFVSSFVQEAMLGARIEHPNVVRVEELGEERGLYFLVMEYVRGCSVAELLKKLRDLKRTLKPEIAVAIAARIAEGLQAVHETKDEQGKPLALVHRDVSPQNVLISINGHVKLIDFGIAKAMAEGGHTASGSLKGKIRYMSPEQARGLPIDRRSDIYSLGIVLWEMLTRRRMFKDGGDLAVLDRVRSPVIVPPSKYRQGLTKALDDAVLHALEKDPDKRPATARELRAELYAAVPGARDVDSSDLGALINEVMQEELAANEALLPSDARIPLPIRELPAEPTALTVTADVSDEAALAEPMPSIAAPPIERRLPWRSAALVLVLLGIVGVGIAFSIDGREERPAPIEIPAEPALAAPLPPPPPAEREEQVEPEPPPPPARKARIHKKRKVKKDSSGPKRVDGVPLLEDPGF